MLTDEHLAQIRARAEAATPGKWHTAEHWPEMVYDATGHLIVEAVHVDALITERMQAFDTMGAEGGEKS